MAASTQLKDGASRTNRRHQTQSEATQSYVLSLETERFGACVAFYRDLLGPPVWFKEPGLMWLKFGSGHLMIETGGHASDGRKPNKETPTTLLLNAADVNAKAARLESAGIQVSIQDFEWGRVGTLRDPGGNACVPKNTDDSLFN